MGTLALNDVTTGGANVAVGENSLAANTNGAFNTALGTQTLAFNLGGGSNTAVGYDALRSNTTGNSNIALGSLAGFSNLSGSGNIYIGNSTGQPNTTGSNNIYIGNVGFNDESGQIRIGTVANITSGTVIVGISGFTSSGGAPVLVNAGGRLGTTTSSRRFKTDIREVGLASEGLMSLRPVAFRYKPEIDRRDSSSMA